MLGGKKQSGFTLIVYALLALAIIGTLGGIYWRIDSAAFARGKGEVKAEWDAANEAARAREAASSAKAAADLAAERKKRRTVIQERTVYVDREIPKLVYADRCFTPSGVQCINAAIDGKSACRPDADGTVPAAKPAG